jgi:hypothetical protein
MWRLSSALFLAVVVLTGCDDSESKAKKADPAEEKPVEGKKVNVGAGVTLEILPKSRRVLVDAEVCLREGSLEMLLTRKGKKEHEAILAADVDARKIHEALLLTGIKEGKPARWVPKFQVPSGPAVKISLRYTEKGKTKIVSARSWVRIIASGKELDQDWVFAGSQLITNPLDKNNTIYMANEGDLATLCNFDSALLDLPIESSKNDMERGYEAWTERIPEAGTKVTVILEPVIAEKKK